MDNSAPTAGNRQSGALLQNLASDQSGNTLALLAAALFPILAMVGGGVDIGRAYVAESRLQQACDAGVLAARKRLGSDLPPSNQVVGQIAKTGKEFFDLNYPDKRYDAKERKFNMSLEADYAITGSASIELPTSVMGVFGYDMIPISVTCQSRMNFTNLDIMMVLDTTGSMRLTNAGDGLARIDEMRNVIKNFYANIEVAKAPDTRIRYGFVPYSTNVNVGALMQDDWVADNWAYQSREQGEDREVGTTAARHENQTTVNEGVIDWTEIDSYPATFTPDPGGAPETGDEAVTSGTGTYSCDQSAPASTYTSETSVIRPETEEPYAGPPAGTLTREGRRVVEDGSQYRTRRVDETCFIDEKVWSNHIYEYDYVTYPYSYTTYDWIYRQVSYDVSNWRTSGNGCLEERLTSKISDFDNVDLSQNLDLDINTVPSPANPDTQWGPMMNDFVYARSVYASDWETGNFTPEEVTSPSTFLKPGNYWYSGCPAPAAKLKELTTTELDTYLASLSPRGATYHDTGMIWGGRLLSQNGLFASENSDVSGNKPTSRHLIFLTDGQTEAYDAAYSAYGVEPLDQRRWDKDSSLTLVETVEERFKFACNEVKKNNTTIWVIAFGTSLNPAMTECAGPGQYFEADNAADLQKAFSDIAKSMGDLRISG